MKNHIQRLFFALVMLAFSILNAQLSTAQAQGTTVFTYQGQLRDNGTNANGSYTMIFNLYDSLSAGNLIGGPITTTVTMANGLFTVNLDFGAGAFNGSARYLDITVTNGGTTQTLSPRVQVLPSPYALYAAVAANVTNGAITSAQLAAGAVANYNLAANAVATTNIENGAVQANNIASGQVVKTLNGLTDNVAFSAGANAALFTNGNTLQFSAGVPNMQLFVNNGTFIVPSNVTKIKVELWGGGGGGGGSGGATIDGTTYYSPGGGGGSGGYAVNVFAVTPGTSYTVTIGSGGAGGGGAESNGSGGGTTSFGVLMSAGGGSGGTFGDASYGSGGSGGGSSGSIFSPYASDTGGDGGNGGVAGGGAGGRCYIYGSGPAVGGEGAPEELGASGQGGAPGIAIVYY